MQVVLDPLVVRARRLTVNDATVLYLDSPGDVLGQLQPDIQRDLRRRDRVPEPRPFERLAHAVPLADGPDLGRPAYPPRDSWVRQNVGGQGPGEACGDSAGPVGPGPGPA